MNSVFSQLYSAMTPVFFLLLALMVKTAFASIYLVVIYFSVRAIRKIAGCKMGVHARYYSWYALLLAFPLSSAGWNNGIKLAIYELLFLEKTAVPIRILVLVWLAICVLLFAKEIVLHHQTQKAIKKAHPYIDATGLAQRAANLVGYRLERIQVAEVEFIYTAASYGVFKKTIFLPSDHMTSYSESELYLLLLHEMAHIKNRDTVKLYVLGIARCCLWILPLFRRQFIQDTEILCDNRVMGLQEHDRGKYSELLVRECSSKSRVQGVAFSNSYHTVKTRLEALYAYGPEKQRFVFLAGIVFAILLAAFAWSCFSRADWLVINDSPNRGLEIHVLVGDPVSGESVPVMAGYVEASAGPQYADRLDLMQLYTTENPSESEAALFAGACEVTNGQMRIDAQALSEEFKRLEQQGATVLGVTYSTSTFDLIMPQMTEGDFDTVGFSLQELENTSGRYITMPVRKKRVDLALYLIAAHWL